MINYLFKSERLGFRTWTDDDIKDFGPLNADEAVMEHFPETLTRKEVKEFIKRLKAHYTDNGFTYYAVEILDNSEFIGMIGIAQQTYLSKFTPAIDIGWRLKQGAWGKGYATEGAKKCIQYAFNDLGINRLISVCTINNLKSQNVMQKIGMTKIGGFDHPEMVDSPEHLKHHCYEIINSAKI